MGEEKRDLNKNKEAPIPNYKLWRVPAMDDYIYFCDCANIDFGSLVGSSRGIKVHF